MHELSIALNILDVAAEEAERRSIGCVEAVHIKLGPLSGIVKSALLSAFDLAREHSALPEARLVVEDMPIVIYCKHCQAEQPVESIQELVCSVCRTPSNHVVGGREMEITALEITALEIADPEINA
ncbi:hydrogenase maturation nickel metallochaperone HypA [Stieleria sp. ICT_E10.1]|uniref:hydrogenase maturation nickel metallochaperone HypA/HybF n=1 Tax=Stieleria sedimenti TaxID=2976331 RepID=UPI00217F323D|nr:hydrogenase maturation nickel metallochaperone HypA [Stieleria sedimenti]MCS7468651.1 hydrogenase maturation nickel metallochaperone HypA [Stieleria sedimenti]